MPVAVVAAVGVITGSAAGPAVALVACLAVGVPATGILDGLHRTGTWTERARRAGFGLGYGLALLPILRAPLPCALAALLSALVFALSPRWSRPARIRRVTPRHAPRVGRRRIVEAALHFGLIGEIVFAGTWSLLAPGPDALIAGLAAGSLYATAAACAAGLWSRTISQVRHASLALRGLLPWRLSVFLQDAQLRGVLRQVGMSWQFRHAVLQDHLAAGAREAHLRAQGDAGDHFAAMQLARELLEQNRIDEVRAWPHIQAQGMLRRWLIERGEVDELVRLIPVGERHLGGDLAGALAAHGRTEELWERARRGDDTAAYALARLLHEQGDADQAIALLENHGSHSAMGLLAELYVGQGRIDDAVACLTHRAEDAPETPATTSS